VIDNEEKSFNDLLNKAQQDLDALKAFDYDGELAGLNAKLDDAVKKFSPGDHEEYMSPNLDDGTVIFKYKDTLLYNGTVENGYYKEGVMMKKEEGGKCIYKGNFSNEGGVEAFTGIYMTAKQPNTLVAIKGRLTKEEVEGFLCYTDENGEMTKVYYGKMKSGNSVAESMLINLVKKHIIYTQIKDDKPSVYNWEIGKHLVCTESENTIALYYLGDDLIYYGRLVKNEEKFEFVGRGLIIHKNNNFYMGNCEGSKRHGEGKFYILTDDSDVYYLIEGEFNDLEVKDAKIHKFNAKDDKSTLLFEGHINGTHYNGTYHFSDKEFFKGEMENWQKKKGVYHYESGMEFEGEWEDDKIKRGKRLNKEEIEEKKKEEDKEKVEEKLEEHDKKAEEEAVGEPAEGTVGE
jgi:hypothetical protein